MYSARGQQMYEYLSWYYRNSRVMQTVLDSQGVEIDAALAAVTLQRAEGADGLGDPEQLSARLRLARALTPHPRQGRDQLKGVGGAMAQFGCARILSTLVRHSPTTPCARSLVVNPGVTVGSAT